MLKRNILTQILTQTFEIIERMEYHERTIGYITSETHDVFVVVEASENNDYFVTISSYDGGTIHFEAWRDELEQFVEDSFQFNPVLGKVA